MTATPGALAAAREDGQRYARHLAPEDIATAVATQHGFLDGLRAGLAQATPDGQPSVEASSALAVVEAFVDSLSQTLADGALHRTRTAAFARGMQLAQAVAA